MKREEIIDILKRLDTAAILLMETHPAEAESINSFIEKMMAKLDKKGEG